MVVDTKKEAVEAFIQSVLKDHVLSEGMPRTSVDTQDTYAIVGLLRSFLEKVEALEAQVAAADALADALSFYADATVEYPNGTVTFQPGDDNGQRAKAALAAYQAAKEGE